MKASNICDRNVNTASAWVDVPPEGTQETGLPGLLLLQRSRRPEILQLLVVPNLAPVISQIKEVWHRINDANASVIRLKSVRLLPHIRNRILHSWGSGSAW